MARYLKVLCLLLGPVLLASGWGAAWLSAIRVSLQQLQEEEIHPVVTCSGQRRHKVRLKPCRLASGQLAAAARPQFEPAGTKYPPHGLHGGEHGDRNGYGVPLLC